MRSVLCKDHNTYPYRAQNWRNCGYTSLLVAILNSYGIPRKNAAAAAVWWLVPVGKAQVSSHCHDARNSRLPHRILPRHVSLCLSLFFSSSFFFLLLYVMCRGNSNTGNNREFRGVDGTWTSIDVRAQTGRTIVAGCLAFVILRLLVASFSRVCFRSFILSPTDVLSLAFRLVRAHVQIFFWHAHQCLAKSYVKGFVYIYLLISIKRLYCVWIF